MPFPDDDVRKVSDKVPFPVESCDWWLKDYLPVQADDFEDEEIKASLSVKRKQISVRSRATFHPSRLQIISLGGLTNV